MALSVAGTAPSPANRGFAGKSSFFLIVLKAMKNALNGDIRYFPYAN
jgi:hypothetical protein